MVSPVGSVPYSYYNALNPPKVVKPVPPVTLPAPAPKPVPKTNADNVAEAMKFTANLVASVQNLFDYSTTENDNLGMNGIFRAPSPKTSVKAYSSLLNAAYTAPIQKSYNDLNIKTPDAVKAYSKFDPYQAVSNLSIKA